MILLDGEDDSDEHVAIYPNIVVQSLGNVIFMPGVIYDSVTFSLQTFTCIFTYVLYTILSFVNKLL